jgi:septum formation topological specificity factor MinE
VKNSASWDINEYVLNTTTHYTDALNYFYPDTYPKFMSNICSYFLTQENEPVNFLLYSLFLNFNNPILSYNKALAYLALHKYKEFGEELTKIAIYIGIQRQTKADPEKTEEKPRMSFFHNGPWFGKHSKIDNAPSASMCITSQFFDLMFEKFNKTQHEATKQLALIVCKLGSIDPSVQKKYLAYIKDDILEDTHKFFPDLSSAMSSTDLVFFFKAEKGRNLYKMDGS